MALLSLHGFAAGGGRVRDLATRIVRARRKVPAGGVTVICVLAVRMATRLSNGKAGQAASWLARPAAAHARCVCKRDGARTDRLGAIAKDLDLTETAAPGASSWGIPVEGQGSSVRIAF